MHRFLICVVVLAGALFMSAGPAAGFALEGPQWTVDAGQPSTFLTPECGNPPSGGGPTTCYVSFQISSDIFSRGWDGAIRGGAYNWCLHGSPYTGLQQVFCYEDYTSNSGCNFNCDQVSIGTQDLGGPNPDGTQTVGVTSYSSTDSSTYSFSHVDIYMSTNSSINWYVPNGQPIGSGQSDLTAFAMHEFGHGLGLAHPARGPVAVGPVMNCVLYYGTRYSGVADDFNGELYLYDNSNKSHYGNPVTSPC